MNEYLECVIKISKWTLMILAVLFAFFGVIVGCGEVYDWLRAEYGVLIANVVAFTVILGVLVLFLAWCMLCDREYRRKHGSDDDYDCY